MKKIIVKKWLDGKFQEVKSYSVDEVQQIRHHANGLEFVLNGYIRLYDKQCIVEFEDLSDEELACEDEEELIADLSDTSSIPAMVIYENGKVVKVKTGFDII